MTSEREPERWLTDDDPLAVSLRPALRMAQNVGPTTSERDRMWSALAASVPVVAAGAAMTPAVAAARRGGQVTVAARVGGYSGWWIVGSGVVAALIGFSAATFMLRSEKPKAAVENVASAPAPVPVVVVEESSAPASEADTRPSPVDAQATSQRAAEPLDRREHAGMRTPRSANATEGQGGPSHAALTRPEPASKVPEHGSVDVTAELDLLARARRVVASDPARALQLTAEHGRLYQNGVLAQEREVLAIAALARLGHRDLAAARARRFTERYPDSAHRVRLIAELEAP